MFDSVKKTKVQLSQDIFPAEAWELMTKNRENDDLVIIDLRKVIHMIGWDSIFFHSGGYFA